MTGARPAGGFTLIEVLVALGIVAIALTAGLRATTALTNNAMRQSDILLAHLGIWSRQDPWAPAVLEPLIAGLKTRGFCFKTLREHPQYQGWIARHGG